MVLAQIFSFIYNFGYKLTTFLSPDFFQLFYTAFILFVLYSATWLLSVKMGDATLVNFLWGLSFSLQAAIYFYKSLEYSIFSFFTEKFSWEKLTFCVLIFAHGIRLSSLMILREIGKPEDARWHKLREKFGRNFWWLSYFTVFMPAMITNFLVGSLIYSFMNTEKNNIGHLTYWTGILTMLFGGLLGTLADVQKYTFKASRRNEGKILDHGLWGISRHPNYLGEVIYWWGVYMVNFSAGLLWTIFAPMLITFMILFVSGIPVNEAMMKEEHGQDYIEYAKRVPIFIPFLGGGTPKVDQKGEHTEGANIKDVRGENKGIGERDRDRTQGERIGAGGERRGY
jgi:steroid 5-alpha reductase family enzyme